MWKLLRWLLVVILPILGLLAGWKLQPVQKPIWTYQAEYVVKPLGYVNKNSTLLVAEVTSQGKQSLFGLEPETGLEQFRIPITRELLDASAVQIREAALSDDERYVVFPASHYDEKKSKEKQVILFDWKAGKVEKRYWVEQMVQTVFLKNNTLLIRDSKQLSILLLQEPSEPQRFSTHRNYEVVFAMNNELLFNMSPDGSIVYRSYAELPGANNPNLVPKLRLYDVRKRTFLPELTGYYSDLDWSPDGRSFTAVQSVFTNPVINKMTVHSFVRTETGFQEIPEKKITLASQGLNFTFPDKNFRVLHSFSRFNPQGRIGFKNRLASTLRQWINYVLPESAKLLLLDRKTNQCHGTLSGFEERELLAIRYAFSLPEKHGLVIGNERYIDYWNYNPISHWYPLFGLCTGTVLAVFLFILSRKKKPNLHVAQGSSSVTVPRP